MKTFLQRTISCLIIFVCLLACVSVKQVVSAEGEKLYKSLTFNASNNEKGVSSYSNSWGVTIGEDKWNIVNANNNNNQWQYIKIGSKNSASVGSIANTTSFSEKISKVTMTVTAVTAGNINSIKLFVALDSSFTNVTETISVNAKTGTLEFNINEPIENGYYKVQIDCSKGSSNGLISISGLNYYEAPLSEDASSTEKFMNLDTQASAKFAYDVTKKVTEGETVTSYEKATSIAAGDQVVIVCSTKNKEFTGFSTSSTVYGIASDYSNSPNATFVFDVVAGSSSGTFAFKNGTKYLNWSSGNTATQSTSLNTNSSWKVSFSNGNAVITNAKDAARKLQYNAGSPRFACYTSEQTAIQLYKKVIKAGQTVEEDVYTISSAGLRFGATIQKDLYEALLSEGAQFGVAFAKKSELNGSAEFNKDSAVKYNLCSNVVLLDDEENYQFALVINNIPAKAFDEVIVASVYVEIAGVKYVANTQNEYSILTILDYYYENADTLKLDSALMEGLLNAATEQNTIAG